MGHQMAVVHQTTLTPGKLAPLSSWLPSKGWYNATGASPVLARAGGFRLDDPAGTVGIELMIVTDQSGQQPASYHIPLTYRGAPLAGAEHALVGETEHGVLGPRWVYDGTRDPVLMTQLVALLRGGVVAQAQSLSDTPDPTVACYLDGYELSASDLHVIRRLQPRRPDLAAGTDGNRGYVEAGWQLPDGAAVRGLLVVVPD
jgi:hypothetical protein